MSFSKLNISDEDLKKIAHGFYDGLAVAKERCTEYLTPASDKSPDNKSPDNKPSDDDRGIIGMHSTSCTYGGLLNPICKYAMTNMIDEGDSPKFITGGKYSDAPVTQEIDVDVSQTKTVYAGIIAIYDDKIITAVDEYGDFTVTCYSKKKADSKSYVSSLKKAMVSDNQYRGKCLYYGDTSIDFRDESNITWDDVILPEDSKKEILRNTANFLADSSLRKLNMNQRGVILHGPPGTGKTMAVKSLFSSLKGKGVTRLYATADTFRYPSDMNSLFDFMKFTGPTSLAFEDMDLISPDRNEFGDGRKILGSLLNNLDGIRKMKDPFVIVGTTNDISMLDKAIANRPCRFDRKIEIGIPSSEDIGKFYKAMSGNDVSENVVKSSSGFAGAHIQEVVNTARLISSETGRPLGECIEESCGIIRRNFFPLTKESSTQLYKNNSEKMSKEAQDMIMLLPGQDIPSNFDFTTLFPILNNIPDNKGAISNKEATALWNAWKNQDGSVKDNKLKSSGIDNSVIDSLKTKGFIKNIKGDHFSLTKAKGMKLMRQLILTQEINNFETVKEAESVDVQQMNTKIRGGSSGKNIKASAELISVRKSKTLPSTTNLFYNAVKNVSGDSQ